MQNEIYLSWNGKNSQKPMFSVEKKNLKGIFRDLYALKNRSPSYV